NPLLIKVGTSETSTGFTLTVDATTSPVKVTDNGAVVGRILDLAGTALVGTTVILRRSGQADLSTTTIAGGYWEIDNAPVANGWRVIVTTQSGGVVPIDYYSSVSPNKPGVLTVNVTGTTQVNVGDLRLASIGCTLGPTWGGSVATNF